MFLGGDWPPKKGEVSMGKVIVITGQAPNGEVNRVANSLRRHIAGLLSGTCMSRNDFTDDTPEKGVSTAVFTVWLHSDITAEEQSNLEAKASELVISKFHIFDPD